jgi:cephalosporin hydroxylase
MDVLGHGEIITIDINPCVRTSHPRIRYVVGSSTDFGLVNDLLSSRPVETRMVILDSDHSKAHVRSELALFAPYVTPGSYLIVEDTNLNGHPTFPEFGPGPAEAVHEFLTDKDDFVVDRSREKFLMTFNPGGFWKRIK